MSQQPVAFDAVPVLQPTPRKRGRVALHALHPRLREQIEQARLTGGDRTELASLLPLISNYYEQLEDERRGVVRSMQLIAEEARAVDEGLGGEDAGHWQVILDHIKDVVITADADGTVKIFNPTGERIFGYSCSEVIGRSIARLLPELPLNGSIERGLQALASQADESRGDLRPHEMHARHKDGHRFPAELIISGVQLGRRDAFVICLRDTSERARTQQALTSTRCNFSIETRPMSSRPI